MQIPDKLYALVGGTMTFAARTRVEPEAARAAIAQELSAIDADMPIYNVQTRNDFENKMRPRRARVRRTSIAFL